MKKLLLFLACFLVGSVTLPAVAASLDKEGYPLVYLRGSFSSSSWNVNNNYKFNRSGDVYTLKIDKTNPLEACTFKIGDDKWDVIDLGHVIKEYPVNRSMYVDVVTGGGNFKTEGLTDAVISFTYTPGETVTSVKFVIDGIEPEPELDPIGEDVYLIGSLPGSFWQVSDRYKFKREGNVYKLDITSDNPIPAGTEFKIGNDDWKFLDLGASSEGILIDNTQTLTLIQGGHNLKTSNGFDKGNITFVYDEGYYPVNVKFTIDGTEEGPVSGLSGSLPVLYINVYSDEKHTTYNNEVIDRNLNHKNYFEFAEYWLDMNGCEWLEALGGENVGSKEKPLALQIKARGNWTRTGFSKKPFKLKLDKKQSLLGLSKSKHFAILAHADDQKGYLRNFTGFNLGKRIGLPWTPTHQPVEVVINGNYRGLYFLTESIRVDEDRVNIMELEDNVDDPALVTGGYIVELDNYDEDESAQIQMEEKHCSSGQYYDKLRITFDTPEVYSDLQRRFITDQFSAMNDAIGRNDNVIWSYLDLDDAARYYLVNEIVSHVESYHGSTYLFRDRNLTNDDQQKWHFSPLWDMGNAFNGRTDEFLYNCDPFGNTWITSLRENQKFNDKVKATWLWFMQNKYSGIEKDIEEYVGHLAEAAKADRARWKYEPSPAGGSSVADNSDIQSKKLEVLAHLDSKIKWLKGKFGNYESGTYSEPERDTTPAAPLPNYVTTGLDSIEMDNIPGVVEYYNLQGMKVSKPMRGEIYIIRQGNRSYKAIVK